METKINIINKNDGKYRIGINCEDITNLKITIQNNNKKSRTHINIDSLSPKYE